MLRHYDQDERQTDGSRLWDTIRPILMKAFAQEEALDLDDGYWLTLIHGVCVYSDKSRIDELHAYSLQLEGAHLPQKNFMEFSIHFGEWINSGRKR